MVFFLVMMVGIVLHICTDADSCHPFSRESYKYENSYLGRTVGERRFLDLFQEGNRLRALVGGLFQLLRSNTASIFGSIDRK